MGGWFSSYWGYADDNQVDPGCGLTGKEKRLVTETWTILHRDPLKLGITLMQAFFTKHPEYQSLFHSFEDVPIEDLPKNKRFQAHASSIVSALDSTIGSLKDPGLLEAMLLTLGEKHHKRGQTKKQFNDLREVVTTIFGEILGSRWTPEVSDAWKAALDAVYGIIFRALQ